MLNQIKEKVLTAIIVAIILGGLILMWNWASKGGIIRAMNGVTKAEVTEILATESKNIYTQLLEERINKLKNGIELPSTGGNAKSSLCPIGSFVIGFRMQSDRGGPHGIVSNVIPVCRELG